jgi:hypothetical protein
MKIAKYIGLSLAATFLLEVALYVTWAWEVFPASALLVGIYYIVFRKDQERMIYLKGFLGGVGGFTAAYILTLAWRIHSLPTNQSWIAPGLVWLIAWPLGSVLGAYLAVR